MSTSFDLRPLSQQIHNVGREVINNLGNQINGVQAHLGAVRNDLQLTRTELAGLREEFRQFIEETARAAAVQQSQMKVVDLKARLDREFGHYSVVRQTSVGLLQGFDIGDISNAVATSVAEELMTQTPPLAGWPRPWRPWRPGPTTAGTSPRSRSGRPSPATATRPACSSPWCCAARDACPVRCAGCATTWPRSTRRR